MNDARRPESQDHQPPKAELNVGLRGGIVSEKHRQSMGDAIWLFMWCVRAQTSERFGVGQVYGEVPITYGRICTETKFPERTLQRWMKRLQDAGYLSVDYRAGGMVIRVQKAKKFGVPEVAARAPEVRQEWRTSSARSGGPGTPEVADPLRKHESVNETWREKEPPTPLPSGAPPPEPAAGLGEVLAEAASAIYERRYGRQPRWINREEHTVTELICAHPDITLEEFCAAYQNMVDSTEAFTAKQHGSLTYFCNHLDQFTDGPQHGGKQSAPSNGNRGCHVTAEPNRISPAGTNPSWFGPHQSKPVVPGELDGETVCVCEGCKSVRNPGSSSHASHSDSLSRSGDARSIADFQAVNRIDGQRSEVAS